MGADVGNNALSLPLSLSSRPACWEVVGHELPEEDRSSAMRAVVVDAMP